MNIPVDFHHMFTLSSALHSCLHFSPSFWDNLPGSKAHHFVFPLVYASGAGLSIWKCLNFIFFIIELLFTCSKMCSSVNVYLVLISVPSRPRTPPFPQRATCLVHLPCLTGLTTILTLVTESTCVFKLHIPGSHCMCSFMLPSFARNSYWDLSMILHLSVACSFLLLTSILLREYAAIRLSSLLLPDI